MKRTKEEAEETRLTIIACALELFARQGVVQTSLVQVANAAQVTRGAIYWHFKNKMDLFDAVWEHYSEPFNRLGRAGLEVSEPDPLGRMMELFRFLLLAATERKEFENMFRICMNSDSCKDQDAQFHAHFESMRDEWDAERQQTLQNAIQKGQLPTDLDVRKASRFMHIMIEGYLREALKKPQEQILENEVDFVLESSLLILHNSTNLRRT